LSAEWLRLLLHSLVGHGLTTGEPDLARFVDLEHLHADLIALLEDVVHATDALLGDLRDVQEAVGARHDLDEGPEINDLAHGSAIDLANFGFRRDTHDAVDRLLHRHAVVGCDLHRAVILDVDRATGLLDDRPDDLATRADDVADLVGADLDRRD